MFPKSTHAGAQQVWRGRTGWEAEPGAHALVAWGHANPPGAPPLQTHSSGSPGAKMGPVPGGMTSPLPRPYT